MTDNGDFVYDELAPGPDARWEGEWITTGSFQSAIELSWKAARDRGAPTSLRIVSWAVRGNNPVRDYKIDFD